jgi:putative ABC transport system ATP-binding protein
LKELTMLECQSITKGFNEGGERRDVLRGITLECKPGDKCVVVGPSGSGKTTLLSILGCILSPCSGTVQINGEPIRHSSKAQMVAVRRKYIGFVFQQAHLLPFLSIEDNVRAVASNVGMKRDDIQQRLESVFERLGIRHLKRTSPMRVSGGEKQRVAIARAVIHRPAIVLADEPTAALDWQNGQAAVQLLCELVEQEHAVLITVTHDTRLLSFFSRVFRIDQGTVVEE